MHVAFDPHEIVGSETDQCVGRQTELYGEIPITIVYDRAGKELWRHQGPIERRKTIAELRELLRRNR